MRTPNTTTPCSSGQMNAALPVMPTNGAPTAAGGPSGKMWRAAPPGTASTGPGPAGASMCSRLPSICWPSSPSIRRTGGNTAMWPCAAPQSRPCCGCWSRNPACGRSGCAWTTTRRGSRPLAALRMPCGSGDMRTSPSSGPSTRTGRRT